MVKVNLSLQISSQAGLGKQLRNNLCYKTQQLTITSSEIKQTYIIHYNTHVINAIQELTKCTLQCFLEDPRFGIITTPACLRPNPRGTGARPNRNEVPTGSNIEFVRYGCTDVDHMNKNEQTQAGLVWSCDALWLIRSFLLS